MPYAYPCGGLLHDCKTSIFAKVRFQLYSIPNINTERLNVNNTFLCSNGPFAWLTGY